MFKHLLLFSCIAFAGCFSHRAPIAPGTVPTQTNLPAQDEEYGHQVFSMLNEQYEIEYDDTKVNRVRALVDRLTKAAGAEKNPWHVYVLKDDEFKNAAATRGNFVFIWTGLINAVPDDGELATVIAHEIGHVLAGHTDPDPAEEVNSMLSEVAGRTAGEIIARQIPFGGLVASLGELLIKSSIEAMIVNPELQRKELEADHIGLFLTAKAGIAPQKSVQFWERVKEDPDFSGGALQFLSTHPSSDQRLEQLKALLPQAEDVYHGKATGDTWADFAHKPNDQMESSNAETWVTRAPILPVFSKATNKSEVVDELVRDTRVKVKAKHGEWLEIEKPVKGFVRSTELQPND